MTDISLLTSTGFRPEAFSLCRRWVSRFDTRGLKVEWIIVDDSGELSDGVEVDGIETTVIPGTPETTYCSMLPNISRAIQASSGYLLIVIEDDDWYADDYVDVIFKAYRSTWAKLIGFANAGYYNVRNRTWMTRCSYDYASLCRTAFSRSIARRVSDLAMDCYREKTISLDMRVWGAGGAVGDERYNFVHVPFRCISIKGMPGRGGAGSLHKVGMPYKDEEEAPLLRSWIGSDADLYKEFMK